MTFKKAWVALIADDHILLGKRAEKINNGGQWNLFGGGAHKYETPTEAAIRELSEEAGLFARRGDLRFTGYRQEAVYYTYNLSKDRAKQMVSLNPDENSKAKWFPLDALPKNKHYSLDTFANYHISNGCLKRDKKPLFNCTFQHDVVALTPASNYDTVRAVFCNELVGSFIWSKDNRFLYTLKVTESYRGLGFARNLLDYAATHYEYPINLTAKADGGLAQHELTGFYQRYGFKTLDSDEKVMRLTAESRVEARLAAHAKLKDQANV